MKTYKQLLEALNNQQRASLKIYSGSGASTFNDVLHKATKGKEIRRLPGEHAAIHIPNLDAAFADKRNHGTTAKYVYSGVPESPERIFKLDKEKNPNHDPSHVHVHLPAYTSTSKKMSVAEDFGGFVKDDDGVNAHHILKIKVDPNHPHIDMNKHKTTYHEHEAEVLLHRGTRLKIHANPEVQEVKPYFGKAKGYREKIWNAEIVGHHLDDLSGPLGEFGYQK